MRRVTIIFDPFRANQQGETPLTTMNAWLRGLIGPTARHDGLTLRVLDRLEEAPPRHADLRSSICGEKLFEGWVRSATRVGVPGDAERYLRRLFGDDLVIGGIPFWLQDVLARARQPFLSFDISNLRFLDDLPLDISTNVPALAAWARRNSLTDEDALDAAAVQAARAGLLGIDLELRRFHGCAVFFGQVELDLALISGARLITPDLAAEAALAALENYPHVLFKRHPYATTPGLLPHLAAARRVHIVEGSTYGLLSSPHVEAAIAISSSVVHEAKYFGTRGIALFSRDIDTIEIAGVERVARVGSKLLLGEGLRMWLRAVAENGIDAELPVEHASGRNPAPGLKLRDSWPFDWGRSDAAPVTIRPAETLPRPLPDAANPGVPLAIGVVHGFDLAAPALAGSFFGLTSPYAQGRWMTANRSSIALALADAARGRDLAVRLTVRIIPTERHPIQVLTVHDASNRPLARVALAKPYEQTEDVVIHVPCDEGADGESLYLSFSVPALVDFAAEGMAGNAEPLGPCLVSIEVTPSIEAR